MAGGFTSTVANASVWFEYNTTGFGVSGETLPGPILTTPSVVQSTLSGTYNYSLSGLAANTTYYFRFVAKNSAGTTRGVEKSFSTLANATPPGTLTVTTSAATNVATTSATFNGAYTNGLNYTYWFDYGTTPSVTSKTPQTTINSTSGTIIKSITGLTVNTTYYYRLVLQIGAGAPVYGATLNFKTPSLPLSFTTTYASGTTSTGATLNGSYTNGGGVNFGFEYGTSSTFVAGSTMVTAPVSSAASSGTVAKAVTGLISGTTYYARLVAYPGGVTTYSTPVAFTTSGAIPSTGVVSTTTSATNISTVGATLNGTYTANTTGINFSFEYGTTTSFGSTTYSVTSTTSPGALSIAIAGLTPNTNYYYRLVGFKNGVPSYGGMAVFTTGASTGLVFSTSPATNITQTSATLNGTFSGATGQHFVFEYGSTTSAVITPTTASGNLTINVTGLAPDTSYGFRIGAFGSNGTITYNSSSSTMFKTLALAPAAVTTLAATNIISTGATLNGSYANGAGYNFEFEYGANSPVFTNTTSSTTSGTESGTVPKVITGLSPNTTYYFKFKGWKNDDPIEGAILSFRTPAAAPSGN